MWAVDGIDNTPMSINHSEDLAEKILKKVTQTLNVREQAKFCIIERKVVIISC